jgi:hypothetical protein
MVAFYMCVSRFDLPCGGSKFSRFCSFMAAMRACIVMPWLRDALGVSLYEHQQQERQFWLVQLLHGALSQQLWPAGFSHFCSFMAVMRACIIMPSLQNALGVSLQRSSSSSTSVSSTAVLEG